MRTLGLNYYIIIVFCISVRKWACLLGLRLFVKMEECSECSMFPRAVDELMEELTNSLHTVVNDLLLKLYDKFTEAERQDIDASRTNINKVKKLFIILKTKSIDAHQKCLKALEELGHHDIADKLRQKMKNLPRTIAGKPFLVRVLYMDYDNEDFAIVSQSAKEAGP